MRHLLRSLAIAMAVCAGPIGCDGILPDLPAKQLEERYATAPSEFVTLPSGARVHYRIEGDPTKPTLVLLHGAADSLFTWDGWIDALKDDHRLVRVDLAGHALTGPVPGERYAAADQVALLNEFVDALGLGRVSVAGNSFGGTTAWTWAAMSPERIDKVILLNAGGYPSDAVPLGYARLPVVGKLLIEDWTPARWLLKRQYDELLVDDEVATPALVERSQDLIRREGNRHATWLRQNDAQPSPVQPSDVERPTLILWGDQDPWFDPSYGRRFEADIESSTLCARAKSGHMPMLDEPRETAALAHRFLAGEPLPECDTAEEIERPNIVLLIGDDHGYPYFGFTGNDAVQTPNLDTLARGGTVFSFAHSTASVCAPSLNSLLTGLYPSQWHRHLKDLRGLGYRDVRRRSAIRHVATLPRVLAEVGYASFQGGKFWEGPYQTAGFTSGTVESEDAALQGGDQAFGRTTLEPVFDFIDGHAQQPFFLWFAPMLPHTPFNAPEEYRRLYRGKNLPAQVAAYYANCTWFDDLVGRLLRHLEARGLRERTLVVYLSDNGWHQRAVLKEKNLGKATMHEIGFRTPLVFNWQGRVPAGKVSDRLVSLVDVFPTLVDYAGAKLPAGRVGIDLRPVIDGRGAAERDALIGMMLRPNEPEAGAAVVSDAAPGQKTAGKGSERAYYLTERDWHYVWYASRGQESLYDKRRDPEEGDDVAAQHPERTAEFRRRIERWEADVTRAVADVRPPSPEPTATSSSAGRESPAVAVEPVGE